VIDVVGRLTTNSPSLMIEAALDGFGLAFVNEALLTEPMKKGRLIRVLEDWTPPFAGLALYYPGHRHIPAGLRALVGVVRDLVQR
jgi:DNA-binding transcriptional LysR family regulator